MPWHAGKLLVAQSTNIFKHGDEVSPLRQCWRAVALKVQGPISTGGVFPSIRFQPVFVTRSLVSIVKRHFANQLIAFQHGDSGRNTAVGGVMLFFIDEGDPCRLQSSLAYACRLQSDLKTSC